MDTRENLRISNLVHPPCSPDLNPIESMWYRLKLKMEPHGRVATTETELWQQALNAWDEIDMETVNLEVATMEECRMELIKAKSMQTSF